MSRFITPALLALSLATLPLFALAADNQQNKKTPNPTSIRPVYAPNGTFYFCLADHKYPDERKFTVALSPKGQINLGMTIPQGHFRPGGKYDLMLSFNKEAGRKNRAEALDEETLLLQMGALPTFRKKLETAQTLSVSANDKTLDFALPPMDALLKGLDACIATKQNTRDEKAAKAESLMPEMLKALLITAGFTDIVPLPTDHIPEKERPADFIWRTGNLMAGIRERQVPPDKSLADMIGLHMQGLKRQCVGSFKADIGKEQTYGGLRLSVAQASCTPKEGTEGKAVTVALVFYLTAKSGFTVFTHEAPSLRKDEALAARDKLAKAIISLAKE